MMNSLNMHTENDIHWLAHVPKSTAHVNNRWFVQRDKTKTAVTKIASACSHVDCFLIDSLTNLPLQPSISWT